MHTRSYAQLRFVTAWLFVGAFPLTALAQGGQPPTAPAGQGPMIVERVKSGFVFAPEVKVTRLDRRVSELVGGYAGWLTDRTFFIGGGGYWMPNQTRDRQLAYGGVVIGMQARENKRVGFGVKGLVGGGRATMVRSITLFDDHNRDELVRIQGLIPNISSNRPNIPTKILPPVPVVTSARVRDQFFVAEPEGHVIVNLTRRFRLTASAGYRFAGSRERGSRDDLSGATGSIGLQIGTGGS